MVDERRPLFARDFPRAPQLDALVDAFAQGNYAHVRAEGPRLAESAEQDDVRRAARTLVERTKPDPLAVGLLAVTAVLLVALTAYWIVHGKPPAGATRTAPTIEHVH